MNLCIFIRKERNSLWILKCHFKRILSHRHNWWQRFLGHFDTEGVKGKRYWEWRLCQPSENVSNMLKING